MKARVCEFCETVVTDESTKMVYSIVISEAEELTSNNQKEKRLLLDVADSCHDCTAKVRKFLVAMKRSKGK